MLRSLVLPLLLVVLAPIPAHAADRLFRGGFDAFNHPGVLLDPAQLQFVRARLQASAEPWASAMQKLRSGRWGDRALEPPYSSTGFPARAQATIQCGWEGTNLGCDELRYDAITAYTHALLFAYTGNPDNALTAMRFMDAWASTLTTIRHDRSDVSTRDGPLRAAWAGAMFTRAGEIIRYRYPGWSPVAVARFSSMLRNVFMPLLTVENICCDANWVLSYAEAKVSMGVFLDDRAAFDEGIQWWREQVPAAAYALASDGPTPRPPPHNGMPLAPYWNTDRPIVDGQQAELCRDFDHLAMGFSAIFGAAETAYLQGLDLFGEERPRLTRGLEFNATRLQRAATGQAWIPGVCDGPVSTAGRYNWPLSWEIGYNAYAARLGEPLPGTSALLVETRLIPKHADANMAWENLTHAAGPLP